MLTLYITRHGETEWNIQKRMQGWKDSELTVNGRRNAELLGKRMKEVDFEAIYASSSKRTETTANLIKGDKDIPIILDDNLKEIHMGKWEGETFSVIKDKYPIEFHSFWNTPHLYDSIDGEHFDDLKKRVLKSLTSIRDNHRSGNILIVTHSVVIKTLLAHFKKLPLEKLWDPPFIHDTSLTIVECIEQDYFIVMEGDITHRVIETVGGVKNE